MSLNDPFSNALSKIESYENLGRKEVTISPSSKVLKSILQIMNEKGYVGTFKDENDGRGGVLVLNLIGKINKCGVIKPRFPCAMEDYEKFEKRFLLSKGFGIIFVSTPKGIMTHDEAKEKKMGGRLIGYCY